jgi:N-acylneuraminate cytidylyltransferase
MNIAIIPARGGSRRIPGKNTREFSHLPIIAWSILTAKLSRLFDQTYVSSDDPRTRIIGRKSGAIGIEREPHLAEDHVGTQEVMRETLQQLEMASPNPPAIEHACCIYATAPMMLSGDLREGFEAMHQHGGYAYVHGWFYWGRAEWFLRNVPLSQGIELARPEGRWIDINTEDDWIRAERMYAELHKETA